MSSRRARADASATPASGRTTPLWVTVLYLDWVSRFPFAPWLLHKPPASPLDRS